MRRSRKEKAPLLQGFLGTLLGHWDNSGTRFAGVWRSSSSSRAFYVFVSIEIDGAGNRNRTYDLRITNAPLYQLSYSGVVAAATVAAAGCGF
jgi:hypothetical protein